MADASPVAKPRRERRHIMFRVESATLRNGVKCAVLVARFASDRNQLKARGYRVGDELRAVLPEIKTIEVSVPQSLAFDRMEQGQFEQFYRGLCGYICAEYWPHCTADEVAAMAELMDREAAA